MKRTRKTILQALVLPLLVVCWAHTGFTGQMSSCEKCHTDETLLKKAYTPPKQAAVAEEGEG
jgi:hypothetical protein